MLKCLTEIQLTLFIEGKLSKTEVGKICQHIAKCKYCYRILADIIELEELEADSLLPQLARQEIDNAFQAAEKLIESKVKYLPTISRIKNCHQTESEPESNMFSGRIIPTTGFSKNSVNFDISSFNPSCVEKNQKNLSPPVRNQEILSSQSVEAKMGIATMYEELIKFLAPFLPFLMNAGNKVFDGMNTKAGEDAWDKSKAVWAKLKPKIETKPAALEAAEDVASSPNDKDLQIVLRVQLKKLLEQDQLLAREVAQIMQVNI